MTLWWLMACGGGGAGVSFVSDPQVSFRLEPTASTTLNESTLIMDRFVVDQCGTSSTPASVDVVSMPNGRSEGRFLPSPDLDGCGVAFASVGMTVGFSTSEGTYRFTAEEFDIVVDEPFPANRDLEIVLGGTGWVDELAAVGEPAAYAVAGRPDIEAAFFDALVFDTTLQVVER